VVDAELGVLARLTSYIGGMPVQKYEPEDLAVLAGEFRVDLPAGLPVTEAGPFDDFRSPGPDGPPLTPPRTRAIVRPRFSTVRYTRKLGSKSTITNGRACSSRSLRASRTCLHANRPITT
jgi:hypothetical protein